jgi:hypothetical protein
MAVSSVTGTAGCRVRDAGNGAVARRRVTIWLSRMFASSDEPRWRMQN